MVPLDKTKTYNDHEEIKKMGAIWNGRFWYVPPNNDYKEFTRWLPNHILQPLLNHEEIILASYFKKTLYSILKRGFKDDIKQGRANEDDWTLYTYWINNADWLSMESLLEKADLDVFPIIELNNLPFNKCPRGFEVRGIGDYCSYNDVFEQYQTTGLFFTDELKFAVYFYKKINEKYYFQERDIDIYEFYDDNAEEQIFNDIFETLKTGPRHNKF
ncbi:hypothetical protein D081_1974 [Anaerovibrio sp. JC8]|uniref:DUF5710 domain-containing protein n=1 Tax=Anaerovibrio sp. JC8 TaxID=1240085 RepID=UPI000A0C11D9|nr:DUF5710 domain-containing protein [Anaerovibrio sp. JC8]ORT99422.1 hypothetical protein D081_1974 [Anaerovibrio sp. JC8]